MIATEEPLAHVAYVYDGTPEGLLTAVFQAYANHGEPHSSPALIRAFGP